jgi:hypothetical protein
LIGHENPGRIAQRESVPFTRERSKVRSLVRPPLDLYFQSLNELIPWRRAPEKLGHNMGTSVRHGWRLAKPFHGPYSGGQIGMPGDLRELITASFDAASADAWSKFTVGEADKLVLHEAALKVLKVFPGQMPGQCALMSALYSLALGRE